jgi:hypothetical protein
MRLSLKKIVVPGIPLAVVLVAGCIVLWFSAYFGGRISTLPLQNPDFAKNIQLFIFPDSLLSNIISIIFVFINAFLIGQINNRYTVIRTRTFLPIFIFLLLMGSWNETHVTNGSHLALTFIIISLFYFFSMHRNKKATEQAFMGSFFIGLSSLLIYPFIFLIPACWIGFEFFQGLSLRTFLASILGTLAPWLLYLSILFLLHNEIAFSTVFNFPASFSLSIFTLPQMIYFSAICVIILISLAGMFSISNRDAIQTRNMLNFILLLFVSIVVLLVIFNSLYSLFLPVFAMIYALLFSHPLTLKKSNFYVIIFFVFCLLNLAFVISKYIHI